MKIWLPIIGEAIAWEPREHPQWSESTQFRS